MRSKRRVTHRHHTDTEQNLSSVASRNAAATHSQPPHPTQLQRNPQAHLLQLQGLLGNQAVGRILARSATPTAAKPVQQKESSDKTQPGLLVMRAPTDKKKPAQPQETRLPGSKTKPTNGLTVPKPSMIPSTNPSPTSIPMVAVGKSPIFTSKNREQNHQNKKRKSPTPSLFPPCA